MLDLNTIPDVRSLTSWEDAAWSLLEHCLENSICFSSGEIAHALRTQKPEFRFSVAQLGEYVKDRFFEGSLLFGSKNTTQYEAALQVSRFTDGSSRTPAGTQVFVYAPSTFLGSNHDFEVDIPKPGFTPTALEKKQFKAISQTANETVATVHNDGRLHIPRKAFEVLSGNSGTSLNGNDPVWVSFDEENKTIRVSFDRGDYQHNLQKDRGRLRFASPVEGMKFEEGSNYSIEFNQDEIIIHIE